MKIRYAVWLILSMPVLLFAQTTDWHYLGQAPPNLQPDIFARGIISGKGRIHSFPSVSPDGKEIVWMTLPPKVWSVRYESGRWTEPETPGYASDIFCLRPCFSPDGRRIWFASNLPGGNGRLDIGEVERMDSGWSTPINPGPPLTAAGFEAQATLTESGTVYYNGPVEGKRWNRGILRARFVNGQYQKPEILPASINLMDTRAVDYTPFIAPDESFLLFCSNRHDLSGESCRIYVSFRNDPDRWSDPVNLSDRIGFDGDSRDPALSPDRNYLFFSSGENIYWVSARILDGMESRDEQSH